MTKRNVPPTIRVTKVPGTDDWRVKRDGAQRAIRITDTQREADRIARRVARGSGNSEVVTHGEDGRIRSKDTIGGADPNPPRDREH
jgi:hypothetical protein